MEFHRFAILFSLNLMMLMTVHAALPPQLYWERMLPTTPIPGPIIELLNQGSDALRVAHIEQVINRDQEISPMKWEETTTQVDFAREKYKKYNAKETTTQVDFAREKYKKYNAKETTAEVDFAREKYKRYNAKETTAEVDFAREKYKRYNAKESTPQVDFAREKYKRYNTKETTPEIDFAREKYKRYNAKDTAQVDFVREKYKKYNAKDTTPQVDFAREKYKRYNAKETTPQVDFVREKYKKYNDKETAPQLDFLPDNSHELHDNPKGDLFFFEENLRPGTKFDAHFVKGKYETQLLPREVAELIPFSSEKVKYMIMVKPWSENAEVVKDVISVCEDPPMHGEEKHCATSLESMVDFVTSKIEKNVQVVSTEIERESKSDKFSVKDGAKKLTDDILIVCHRMKYPFAVFYCHHLPNTTAYLIPLEGEDGTRVKATAVCHKDTSEWDPDHISFQVLKIKPGTVPVCHFFNEGDLLWFAK